MATKEGMITPCILIGCCGAFGAACNRQKIREKYSYDGSYISDLAVSCCCGCCAVVQETREVRSREG